MNVTVALHVRTSVLHGNSKLQSLFECAGYNPLTDVRTRAETEALLNLLQSGAFPSGQMYVQLWLSAMPLCDLKDRLISIARPRGIRVSVFTVVSNPIQYSITSCDAAKGGATCNMQHAPQCAALLRTVSETCLNGNLDVQSRCSEAAALFDWFAGEGDLSLKLLLRNGLPVSATGQHNSGCKVAMRARNPLPLATLSAEEVLRRRDAAGSDWTLFHKARVAQCSIGHYVRNPTRDTAPYTIPHTPLTYHIANCDRQKRFWKSWEWESMDCGTLNHQQYCDALQNERILFVGDSLSDMQFSSLARLMGADVSIESGKELNKLFRSCNNRTLVGYIRNDDLYEHPEGAKRHGASNFRTWWATSYAYTTLVLNRGAHPVTEAQLVEQMSAAATRIAQHPAKIIWRTNVPGHETCLDARRPLTKRYVPSNTSRFASYKWHQFQRRNDLIFEILESIAPGRTIYLDAHELSNSRADRHIGRIHRAQGKGYSEDCLHYCLPGPPDDWNALLKELLLSQHATQNEFAHAGRSESKFSLSR